MAASTITRDTWTNDTGTAANPNGDGTLLANTVLQNHIYARVDQMFAGAGAYTTFTLGGIFSVEGFGSHLLSSGGTGANQLTVRNTTAGTGNFAAVNIGNNSSATLAIIASFSSTFSSAAYNFASGTTFVTSGSGGLSVVASDAAGMIRFYTGSAVERMRLAASGGLSIGDTTDPGAGALRVISSSTVRPFVAIGSDSATSGVVGTFYSNVSARTTFLHLSDNATYNTCIGTLTTGNVAFYKDRLPGVAGTQFFVAANNGQVGMGPSGTITGFQAVSINFDGTSGFGGAAKGIGISETANTNGCTYIEFQNSGTIGSITRNAATAAVLYNTTSDQRLKNDLGLASDLSGLLAVRVHDFTWKGNGTASRGVFAQETIGVFPGAISQGDDSVNEDGHLSKPWGVDYSKFVPDLIVAVQQQHARLCALEAKQ